jgi:hypothetical protein
MVVKKSKEQEQDKNPIDGIRMSELLTDMRSWKTKNKYETKDNEYIINGKLHEKDMQIEALTKKQEEMESKFKQILEKIDTGRLS